MSTSNAQAAKIQGTSIPETALTDMASALTSIALKTQNQKWQVGKTPIDERKEWSFLIPELGITIHIHRRPVGEKRYAGRGEIISLEPGFLARFSNALGQTAAYL